MAPRALWVAAHHASLPRRLPGSWAHLLEMVDALLQRGLTDVSSKVHLLCIHQSKARRFRPTGYRSLTLQQPSPA